jgi:hypothetical protein
MRLAWILILSAALASSAETAGFGERVQPILDRSCTQCHGPKKQKAGLRLDSAGAVLLGSKEGPVVVPGKPSDSELIRRVSLPAGDDDFMPSGGHTPLSPQEIALLGAWIAAGAPESADFVLPSEGPKAPEPPAAPDYGPRLTQAQALARSLGISLVPISRVTTDGLVLRTASAPARCTDLVLERLGPFADLIVEAELGRTGVTDKGLEAVASWKNLRSLDLTRTAVTSAGVPRLAALGRLERLNLTGTRVDGTGVDAARGLPSRPRVWAFQGP